jgi:multidrug resistance efflux pump
MPEPKNLVQSWLNLQCNMLSRAFRALVLQSDTDGSYRAVAHWPEASKTTAALSNVAAAAARKSSCTIDQFEASGTVTGREGDIVTCPLCRAGGQFGVVAVEVPAGGEAQRRAVAKALRWGSAWLELLLREQSSAAEGHLLTVVDMVAISLEHFSFQESASAVVSELALRLGCERVSIGFTRRQHSHVYAMSRSASIDTRMSLVKAVGAAMDEALDQDTTIVFPKRDRQCARVMRSHAELSRGYGAGSVCTIPINQEGRLVGAMVFEHREPSRFGTETVTLCEAVVALVGPILTGKRLEERWFAPKLWDGLRGQAAKLTGPRHVRFKLGTAMIVALALFLAFATGEHRVSADATLESMVQRAVTAPFDGYVAESEVRAGDLVKEDQVLCLLEDRDLELEQFKWSSETAKLQKEYREAMAAHENARVRILQAQIEQAAAQLELVEEQLSRTRVIAPVDGMVVKGDLTQSLGAPVERGDLLFEVAPLDDYRVMLAVDEREVGDLMPGQAGHLALAGLPSEPFPIVVQRITPISTVDDGRNYFAVQAKLLGDTGQLLRPGMQGVGKIYIGQRKLAWIWTHDLIDWLRLWSWSWSSWA